MALVMSFEDWVSQYGTISLTNDGGTTPTLVAGYSLDDMKTRALGDVCRINSSTGTTIIRIDFSQTTSTAMAMGMLSLVSDQAFTLIFKTFSTTTARTSDTYHNVVSSLGTSLLNSAAFLHDTPAGSINRLEIWLVPFVGVSTTVDIGRILYGNAFQSAYSTGMMDTGPEDSGGTELTRGGGAIPRIGVVSRTMTLPMPNLSPAEVFCVGGGAVGPLSTLLLEPSVHSVGKTGEVLAFQEDITNTMRPLYGHFIETPRFKPLAQSVYESSLVMREER
jgi:hypothetical protein